MSSRTSITCQSNSLWCIVLKKINIPSMAYKRESVPGTLDLPKLVLQISHKGTILCYIFTISGMCAFVLQHIERYPALVISYMFLRKGEFFHLWIYFFWCSFKSNWFTQVTKCRSISIFHVSHASKIYVYDASGNFCTH